MYVVEELSILDQLEFGAQKWPYLFLRNKNYNVPEIASITKK
jgi:hypothetical protein